jgi:short-subunit dehydrogenase
VRKQFDVNVFGVMNLTRSILPYFRKKRGGTIINITSVGGRITFPLYSVYHASKWAIEGFAESLQYELKEFNIRIKNVQPGAIKTDFYDRSQNLFKNEKVTEYDRFENAMLNYMQDAGKNAPGPEVVAKTIYDAATDSGYKLRYPSGKQAMLTLTFRSLLPSRWFNTGVQKFADRIVKKS